MKLRVCTYNIHKGLTQFNRRIMVHELRQHLRQLNPDIVFLQEVQGRHNRHALRYPNWPEHPQHEFLAQDIWSSVAYQGHAMYQHGHHGNAILSRLPITQTFHQDISAHRFEKRGLLHCEIALPESATPLHCLCVHLALNARGRQSQYAQLVAYIDEYIPANAPLILAGDFNDWRNEADALLAQMLGLTEVFSSPAIQNAPARSFPSAFPLFRLDRIYTRGFHVHHAQVHHGKLWAKMSDHAPLTAELEW